MTTTSPRRESRRQGPYLGVRATREELAAIRAAAAERGTTASDLTRQALIALGVPISR
ncbi:hypothetical protein [Synechococcus sp. EJ6-Ellesmere]|uniref:hypothetical protein n=1 Tax=Synechococcus sp. EJ6-Ellesmere TaxID=2823734 RepID=UPI0020CCC9C3|nr:hypothetical protein [Synechococcus sp. EJ6-Ellesmere]MCP9824504.1 hypothetical protein [Synechococcus sp. EJ6-Ellesmere]